MDIMECVEVVDNSIVFKEGTYTFKVDYTGNIVSNIIGKIAHELAKSPDKPLEGVRINFSDLEKVKDYFGITSEDLKIFGVLVYGCNDINQGSMQLLRMVTLYEMSTNKEE